MPTAPENEVGVLPNPSFTVCESDDAEEKTVSVFHKSKPAFEEFECFDVFDFAVFWGSELNRTIIGFANETEFDEGVVGSFQSFHLLSFR